MDICVARLSGEHKLAASHEGMERCNLKCMSKVVTKELGKAEMSGYRCGVVSLLFTLADLQPLNHRKERTDPIVHLSQPNEGFTE